MSSKNIQVAIKVRPLLRKEREQKQTSCWKIIENSIQLVDSQTEPFCFDHIFNQDASNQIIFDKMAKHIVHSGVQGFNGTIFAYGQTSSGKTYTMMGDEENPGVMVLAAKEIFKEIEKASERQFLLRVGYIEIYNERIFDLLNKKNQDLKIHEAGPGIVSVNCEECIITCEDELLNYLCMGSKERTVGETNMNERSSRSHAIFRIIIESRKIDRSEDDSVNQSVLNLVDLAGSERADQTGARGTRLKEGGHINKSLLFLSNVIKMLSENNEGDSNKYISFRDSKLTRILQASLGGNALTSIICTIKPTAVEETQSTLSFAMRAKSIKNKPQVNEIVSEAAMMKRLEREINLLKTQLAEERSKNKSQIKVGQLEQRIKHEVVKIISCNSLTNLKQQKEQRRRTWCPATSKLEAHMPPPPAADVTTTNSSNAFLSLPMPGTFTAPSMSNSRLPLPKPSKYCTPLITMRSNYDVRPQPEPDIDEEVFAPGEICNFEPLSPFNRTPNTLSLDCKSPPRTNENLRAISITPKCTSNVHSKLKLVENALVELEEFTNLENKLDIKHDTHEALKEQLQLVKSRNSLLEAERLEYIELKDEHTATQQKYDDCLKHCNVLEIQISKLTNLHHSANTKIANYEKQLEELNKKLQQLEMENRDAISLDFEFQSHKNKSKLRETELLEALSEKDKEIVKLERSLNAITEEKLHNTKEELLQLSRVASDTKLNEDGQVCIKCEDLTRLLEENKKVTNEFEKLTLQYEQLQLNYNQVTTDASQVQAKLQDLEQAHNVDVAECAKLRNEIASVREKLEQVQADYTAITCDNQAKTEAYEALNQVINAARDEMLILQVKYENLEGVWQEQQKTINDIQTEYDAIQLKYQCLQAKYDQLEHTALSTQSDCARLQAENECLQTEINELKQRVEQAQKQLLETSYTSSSATKAELAAELASLKTQNDALQAEHMELQKEYDMLSNQLMDQLQDGEELKQQNNSLEAQLTLLKAKQKVEAEELGRTRLEFEEQIKCLRNACSCTRLGRDSWNNLNNVRGSSSESMRSSGLGLEDVDSTLVVSSGAQKLILEQFAQLAEGVDEIELEHKLGQRRCYRAATYASNIKKQKRCMIIKNIQEVISHDEDIDAGSDVTDKSTTNGHSEGSERLEMQGSMLRHTFKIVQRNVEKQEDAAIDELIDSKSLEASIKLLKVENQQLLAEIKTLQEQVEDLTKNNEYLNTEKQTLVESTERTINEMREEMTKLTAELFEKSLFVEKCACQDYQKQIESLVRERAEMTIYCEELQAKTMNASEMCLSMNMSISRSDGDSANRTIDETQNQDGIELKKAAAAQTCCDMNLSTDTLHEADTNNDNGAAAEQQVQSLQTEILHLNQDIEELQATVAKLNIELVEEKSNLEIKLNEMKELDERVEDYEQQLTAIHAEHEQEQQTLLESKEREYKAECNRLQLELLEKLEFNETQGRENLRKYNKEWEESKEQYERIIAELTEKVKVQLEIKQTQQQAEQQHKETLSSLAATNKQLEIKTEQAQRLEQRLNELTQQKEDLEKLTAQDKTDLLEITEKLQQLEQQNNQLDSERKATEAKFITIVQERDAAQQRAAQLATESYANQSLQHELLAMQEQLKQAAQANQEQLKALNELDHKTKELQQKLEHSNNQLADKTEQAKVMEQQLGELHIQCENYMQQIHTLEQQLTETNETLQTIEHNNKKLKATNVLLEQEKVEALLKADKLQQQLKANIVPCKCSNLDALQTDHQRLQEKLQKVQHELNSSKLINEEKVQELKTLNVRLTETDNVLEQVNSMLATKKIELNKMQLRHDELLMVQQKLLKQIEELEVQNTGAETLEDLKQTQAKLSAAQEQATAAEQAKLTALKKIETLLEQMQEHEIDHKTLLAEKVKLQSDLEMLQQDYKTLQHKLAKCIEDKQQLEFERAQLQREKQIVDKQLHELDTNDSKREQIINDLRKQLQYFEQLSNEHEQLQNSIATLKQAHLDSLTQLQQEKQDLQLMLTDYKKQKTESEEKLETLQLKIKTLTKDQHDIENKAKRYDKLLGEHAELEKIFKLVTEEKETHAKKIQHLNEKLQANKVKVNAVQEKSSVQSLHSKELEQKLVAAQASAAQESSRCTILEQSLLAAQSHATAAEKEQASLRLQLRQLNDQLSTEQTALRREVQDMHSRNSELLLKCKTLQASNERLHQTNTAIEPQLKMVQHKAASHAALSEEITTLQAEKQELQIHMTATVEEAGKCTRLLRDDLGRHKELLQQQVEAYNQLRTLLNTKESAFKEEKQKLEGTIDCLMGEKKTLNERIYAAEIALKKYDELCTKQKKSSSDSPNSSMDGGANASFSPRNRRSFERLIGENQQLKSINLNLEDKLMSMQHKTSQIDLAERKSRRLSTHDERRRQSMWVSSRDVETLTDPTDSTCNCVELDKKLKECEKNLFIRDCQVSALNMEIKNHPLKAENIALKKRLQDEQDKSRNEIKKYKQIIVEQKTRAASVLNVAAAAAAASAANKDADAKRQATTKSTAINAETQTESELEAALNKLESKYSDLKNICRFRHGTIKDLEMQIAYLSKEKENSSSNAQLSSLEAGKIKAMKQQNEALKKELHSYKAKYEDAKFVLNSRHAEIQSLRAQLNIQAPYQ